MADRCSTAELFPGKKPQGEYDAFGVYAPSQSVAQSAYHGLYALQHRGQGSVGIIVLNGWTILVYKNMGLVLQVFDKRLLSTLNGRMGVGRVRYATTGASAWENTQPTLGPTCFSSSFIGPAPGDVHSETVMLAHSENLMNAVELIEEIQVRSGEDLTGELGRGSSTDTAALTALFSYVDMPSLADAAPGVLPRLEGAFPLAFMDETHLYVARGRHGFHPLALGRFDGGWVMASETVALDIIDAGFGRGVSPGELLAIGEGDVESHVQAESRRAGCTFEYAYPARPDTTIVGRPVNSAYLEMDRILAEEHPVEVDLVIATLSSGAPAAIGYVQGSGIPYGQGLVKNVHVGRTFTAPAQLQHQRGIHLRFNPMKEVIEGKRLVVVDDSIARGNTQHALVAMLREVEAAEVHIRVSSPPVTWSYFFGVDSPTRGKLIANSMGVEEICNDVGVDTLGYIPPDGMARATEQVRGDLCTACFTGGYPVDVANVATFSRSDLFGRPTGTYNPPEGQ